MYHRAFGARARPLARRFGVRIAPAPAPVAARRAIAHEANLGGIGRVTVFAFTGPVFGGRVCATVANLGSDQFTARVADAPSDDALVTAALTGGGDVSAPLGDASSPAPART